MEVRSLLRRRAQVPAQRTGEEGPRFKEAVVLSGGGSLGAAQVGQLKALYDAGIRPDLFVGCSVGALNATFMATDPRPERVDELEALWRSLTAKDVFGATKRAAVTHIVRRDAHLYDADALHALVRRCVPHRDLSHTAVPVHVVTTDLLTGSPCWWTSGDPVTVLSASACLPAVFPPVALGGSLHVDGGVTCPVPVDRALDLGAARVWVMDVSGGTIGRSDGRMTALDVLLLSFAISRHQLSRPGAEDRHPGQRVVVLPRVDMGKLEMRDFSRTGALIERFHDAAQRSVERELEAAAAGAVGPGPASVAAAG